MEVKKTTKSDLVDGICERLNLPTEKVEWTMLDEAEFGPLLDRTHVQYVVDELFKGIKEALYQGSTLELRGFGTFEIRLRKGKKCARNPKNGELVSVAPHYVAAFRPGQEIKQKLWEFPVESLENTEE